VFRTVTIVVFVTVAGPVPHIQAGVYTPDEPVPFPVADGMAAELPFGPEFEGPFALAFGKLLNDADPRPEAVRGSKNPDRPVVLARIDALKRKPNRSPDEVAALSAAYLRAGDPAGAVNLLAPLSRSRSPDFRVLANLAHAHAARGEWEDAVRWHELAAFEVGVPDDLPGATPEQRKWLQKVERQYYAKWLQIHRQRAAAKLPPEREEVFPLFPVKFVSEAGKYEPGKLAAAEKAKLPPDAVAVVQQLILWAPWDTALYWLLAELYAADGRVRPADVIFFQCANSRQYSNRPLLMEHRHAVGLAADRARRAAPVEAPLFDDGPPEPPKREERDLLAALHLSAGQLIAVGAVFAAVVLAMLALQVRVIRRRFRGCGPAG
jgi:hypothetical protein